MPTCPTTCLLRGAFRRSWSWTIPGTPFWEEQLHLWQDQWSQEGKLMVKIPETRVCKQEKHPLQDSRGPKEKLIFEIPEAKEDTWHQHVFCVCCRKDGRR